MGFDSSSIANELADPADPDRPPAPAGSAAAPLPRGPSPRFSVLIPLYNKAAYIRGALQSVMAQTFADFEVVVVDDGSTDGGADIVESFRDPRVRLLRQANAGVSVARNTAIEQARGEWVVFLDADDWQHPRFLAALEALQQLHPEVHCVATRYVEFRDEGGVPPVCWELPAGPAPVERIDDLAARWMRGASLFTGSVAVRRSLLREMQPCFRPGESFGEDLELWFRLSERTPIALATVPLVGYRTHVHGSLTRRDDARGLPPWVDRMRQRVTAPGFDAARRRSALALIAQFRLSLARDALAAGRRTRAMGLLVQAHHAVGSRRWWFTAFMACWPAEWAGGYLQSGPRPAGVARPLANLQPS
ncbi:glycosyltransferase family 2 protein [Ramlibacter sp. Leaf400]|uniref:glycosyltransferase family 2 protein n=1 Tax=Ramlibacter sp. Leaf400 TaxID=1736365 RepID=UPI0012E39021|nr:glycosyltransferase family A protein [Ramlibacter sp. Leaf400]